jgi:RNA polymerase sigma factor (sigma-70 family)
MSDPSGSAVDWDVLADIVSRYHHRLRLFAMRRLADAVAAEDAAQETLRRVLEALKQGRVRDLQALPSYTFETARHVCQHVIRDRDRAERFTAPFDALEGAPAQTPGPLTTLIAREREAHIRHALSELDETDRVLIWMSFVEGLSAEVIAERLGLTAVNVRVKRHRILRRIGARLGVTSGSPPGPVE